MRSPPHPPPPTYSWVALSLAMSAPSIQTSCPTFVSQTFSVAESLEQRVPTSSTILIPHLSPRNKYKSRRWFPILKLLIKTFFARHSLWAAAMLFRWLCTQSHRGDEKRLVQFTWKKKKLLVADFFTDHSFFCCLSLAGDINLREATCSSSLITDLVSVSNDWDFLTHFFFLIRYTNSLLVLVESQRVCCWQK